MTSCADRLLGMIDDLYADYCGSNTILATEIVIAKLSAWGEFSEMLASSTDFQRIRDHCNHRIDQVREISNSRILAEREREAYLLMEAGYFD